MDKLYNSNFIIFLRRIRKNKIDPSRTYVIQTRHTNITNDRTMVLFQTVITYNLKTLKQYNPASYCLFSSTTRTTLVQNNIYISQPCTNTHIPETLHTIKNMLNIPRLHTDYWHTKAYVKNIHILHKSHKQFYYLYLRSQYLLQLHQKIRHRPIYWLYGGWLVVQHWKQLNSWSRSCWTHIGLPILIFAYKRDPRTSQCIITENYLLS